VTAGESNLRHGGRLLYPERGPSRHAERLAAAVPVEPARLYLVASPGLWYGVETLLSRIDPASALICVEADPGLAALSRAALPPALASEPRLVFLEGTAPEACLAAATSLGAFRRTRLVRLSGGAAFAEAEYLRLSAALDAAFISEWKNRASLLVMGRLWTRNIFRNLARLDEIDPREPPALAGPVIVCGAGPSLESALPLIAELRGKLSVVAVDTALGTLLGAGILPDLLVCLEAQAWNLRDFLPLEGRPCPLLADLSSHPSTFRAFSGPIHVGIVGITEGAFLRRLAGAFPAFLSGPPLGSVGVHAVHTVRALAGPSAQGPLFATGLDFSFPPGKTHARGTPALLALQFEAGRLAPALRLFDTSFRPAATRTASGERSDPVLAGYAALLADELRLPGPALLDLRGGGLPVGARRLGLGEARELIEAAGSDNLRGRAGSRPGEGGRGAQAAAPGAGREFLGKEVDRLCDIEAMLKGRASPGQGGLAASVEGADYLLWSMPDRGRLGQGPQDLLNRILVETEYWIARLEELLRP